MAQHNWVRSEPLERPNQPCRCMWISSRHHSPAAKTELVSELDYSYHPMEPNQVQHDDEQARHNQVIW